MDEGDDERNKYLNYNYDLNIDFNNDNVFQLETNYGYNITFDANFLVNGMGDRGFYTMIGNDNGDFVSDLVVFGLLSNSSIIDAYQYLNTPQCNVTTDLDRYQEYYSWYNLSFYGYSYVQSPADGYNDQDFSNESNINYGKL